MSGPVVAANRALLPLNPVAILEKLSASVKTPSLGLGICLFACLPACLPAHKVLLRLLQSQRAGS